LRALRMHIAYATEQGIPVMKQGILVVKQGIAPDQMIREEVRETVWQDQAQSSRNLTEAPR